MEFNFQSAEIQEIKNIIFDLGGVLLNIDYNRTVEGFRNLGMPGADESFTREIQADIFKDYEIGEVKSELFVSALRNNLPHASTDDQVNEAWCALLGDLPLKRYEMLERLGQKYRLFLLSNTNEIHQLIFESRLDEQFGKDKFLNKFEEVYYSHKIGMRKPDPKLFRWVLNENNLKARETLFIDDTKEHVDSANTLGIRAYCLKAGEEIVEVLKDL